MKTPRYLLGAVLCLVFTGCASVEEDAAYWTRERSRGINLKGELPQIVAEDEELYREYWREEKYLKSISNSRKKDNPMDDFDEEEMAEWMNNQTPGTATRVR